MSNGFFLYGQNTFNMNELAFNVKHLTFPDIYF